MLSNLNNLFAKHKQQKSRKTKNKNREDKRKKSNGNMVWTGRNQKTALIPERTKKGRN